MVRRLILCALLPGLGALFSLERESLALEPRLSAAAAASGRPPECSSPRGRGPSIWDRARLPELDRYCNLVARAQTELATAPEAAKKVALEADQALPGHAAPWAIVARAGLALGQRSEALQAFDRAQAIDPRAIEAPSTLRDLGRVLRQAGRVAESMAVYRTLVPRIDLLGTEEERVLTLLEAAHLSMLVQGLNAKRAGDHLNLDESLAYLREARQRPPTRLTGDVLLSLALVLGRAGADGEAAATLEEAARTNARARAAKDYVATTEDRGAVEAMEGEALGLPGVPAAWEAFLKGAGGAGPWAIAARSRLDHLRRGGRTTSGRRSAIATPKKLAIGR